MQSPSNSRATFSRTSIVVGILVAGTLTSGGIAYWMAEPEYARADLGATDADGSKAPALVFGGGMLGTLLLAAYVRHSLRQSHLIRQEIADRTAELHATKAALETDTNRREEVERALAASEERCRLSAADTQREISDRRRAEQVLNESRQLFDSLMSQLPGMTMRCLPDSELSVTYVSPGAVTLTGHDAVDFMARRVLLSDLIHPEDRPLVNRAIAQALQENTQFEVEFRLRDRGGHERWLLDRGRGFRGLDGKISHVDRLVIDIGARKQAEREKLAFERRLLEGQKLESLGVLSGGIAHDFNNLLAGIVGNTSLATASQAPTSPILQNLKDIEAAALRAAELCNQLLAYAGKGRFAVQKIDVRSFIENTVPLLKLSVSQQAAIRILVPGELPPIMVDAIQLRQIMMNLLTNASEALEDAEGEIIISAGLANSRAIPWPQAALAPDKPDGDFVWIDVRDTGGGMAPETKARIFEPFFTTKFAGRGLGLAAVLGIIRSHHGGLIVTSELGSGATFRLLFPAAAGTAPSAPAQSPSGAGVRYSGTALVVDDENAVRLVASRMVQMCGFEAIVAADGEEGLAQFQRNIDRTSLVLLDITMPRLNGDQVLRQIREKKPHLPVILMSGYSRIEAGPLLGDGKATAFLQKPFTFVQLKDNLKSLLG